ncbi:cyclodeaminase/cyclohydrolase family protein [bacterium]|nr:cyclodeaminase/cyclohydrolase family protein [bacterium]
MKYIDEPIRKYIEDASSGRPTPGGGSIAAMAGALAGSMMNMVCNFTVGNKAYQAVETKARKLLEQGMDLTEEMLRLAVEDTEAYAEVSKAYVLPRVTEEEKKARSLAIQDACKQALKVPSKVMEAGARMLSLLSELVEIGNKNLITDTGVAAILSLAAVESAALNVRINLVFIKDEAFVKEKGDWISDIEAECRANKDAVMEKVNKACGA